MAYPDTKVLWEDLSDIAIPKPPAPNNLDRPIYLTGFTSDKGPEDFRKIEGDMFHKLYGTNVSFARHGQPLLQAANLVNNGARLLAKRVVAEDSKLANTGVVANVKKVSVQKTDANGRPLYLDKTTNLETTTETGNTPVMIQKAQISYQLKTLSTAGNNVNAFGTEFYNTMKHTKNVGEDDQYALFMIMDNGRGESSKRFRIVPDANQRRPMDYTKNIIEILENNNVVEQMAFTVNPDIVENGNNISLYHVIKAKSSQVRAVMFESEIRAFIDNVQYLINDTTGVFSAGDVLFGHNIYGQNITNVVVDNSTVNLSAPTGIPLTGGSNGLFNKTPITASTYAAEMVKVFNGAASDIIYDLDSYRIDFIADANYPPLVKRAIEGLVTFREDCMFLRDLGTACTNVEEIKTTMKDGIKNRFCATYHNYWDIIDPYSKKQITVTATYNVSVKMINHFINGRSRPFAGMMYKIMFDTDEVVEGTVNFTPKHTPSYDQKQDMDDMRVNYVVLHNTIIVMETQYTSQDKYTQLSFISNVLAVQEVIKAIRERCPKIRYNFITTPDFKRYKDDVEAVVSAYTNNFLSLTVEYVQDNVYAVNKIMYAVIKVRFKDFVQSEIFKIIALPTYE